MENETRTDHSTETCAVTRCLQFIGGKWKPIIIFLLRNDCHRFSEFMRAIPNISKQTLTNQLRELEKDGMIKRTVYAEIPPRVKYKISDYGHSILPVVDEMERWGKKRIEKERM
jgi:DNA-binding HxlR family transcriptional regulator